MPGKAGPLISPAVILKFMIFNYRKIERFGERNNIPVFPVNTGGDCLLLAQPYMEGGTDQCPWRCGRTPDSSG